MCLDDVTGIGMGPPSALRVCPPGQCCEFWEDTDEDGLTRRLCGFCGKEQADAQKP